ncbi:unnamed protein product [Ranitomeya imitator]|uniref:Ig-like domain-containing protein n=1 Tax=Ranitomeya imitator TaxID=111125 RepID=A0ABN9LLP3_9NEOB|nr:unnamed protein product [Ranitomeya imitator]
MVKTKESSKDTRNKIVALHQAGKTESASAGKEIEESSTHGCLISGCLISLCLISRCLTMIIALSLCLLTALITVSQAQHSVTLEPSVITASLGENVRLSCTLGGGLTVNTNGVVFMQQKIGSKPTSILYYFNPSSNRRGDGVPARFVGSASGNVGYLDINGVHPEDHGDYYCITWTGSQYDSNGKE